jgi:xanthine dehydrogenase molybdopterin-binding subunit B
VPSEQASKFRLASSASACTNEQREVPEGTPPAWRDNAEPRTGRQEPSTRIDGADKVSGRARYTADIVRPGMLHAKVLRSPHPHARLHRVDVSEALKMPGVKAAVVLPHLLGIADDGSAKHDPSEPSSVITDSRSLQWPRRR